MLSFRDFLETTFDKHSDYWIKKNNLPTSIEPELKPHFNKGLKVLDLGCGGGRLAKSILPYFSSVHGLDASVDLVKQASVESPEIGFSCGDFQSDKAWENVGKVDVIVSNCAIRKDYCKNLKGVVELCRRHLSPSGTLILRIQAFEDLEEVLPERLRSTIFYKEKEIREALSSFKEVKVKREKYKQRFSTVSYFYKFLERINIPYSGRVASLEYFRYYYIVKAVIGE